MKSFLLFCILPLSFLAPFSSIAQNNALDSLEQSYEAHFIQQRESVHLHLNKTTYLIGEEIWWSAYVYNKKVNMPSLETTNLYCGIYDRNGKQIQKELFLVKDGKAHGSFEITEEFASGTYFIKAGTSWMKNFEEENDFVQRITIINDYLAPDENTTATYDLQILPEGGHLIEDVANTVGVRVTNQNGKGIKILKGEVLDQDNVAVANFSNNYYGVGKFDLIYEKSKVYKVKITLGNGEVIQKEVPIAKEKGIALAVNNIMDNKLVVSLKTNVRTLEDIKKEHFYLAVHRDGLMALNSFAFEETTKTINIAKSMLRSGTNIITLFNKDLQPVSERLIFNYTNVNISNVSLERPLKKIRDSISLKINVFSKNNTETSLSVTALPAGTIANSPHNDIVSNFLLQSYLRSRVENPGRYFKDITRKKEFELDLILLTQGWSSYNWNHIFNTPPQTAHPFEFGITIKGKLNSKIRKGDQLVINQGDINSMLFLELAEQPNFSITDVLLKNGDTIKLALKGKNSSLRKPNLDIDFISAINANDSISFGSGSNLSLSFANMAITNENMKVQKSFVLKDAIALDEVVVVQEQKLTRKSPLITSMFRGFKIGKDELRRNAVLTDFIRKNGFNVTINTGNGQVFIANTRPFSGPVAVYLNDFLVRDGNDLFNIPMSRIDEVYIERDGFSGDSNASGGTIRIYQKEGGAGNSRSSFAEKLVVNSFTRPKEFYRPRYSSYLSKDFIEFGVIHWEPKLVTGENSSVTIKLPNDDVSQMKIFVEGMGADGSLVSHVQEISLK
ncbi:MAG: hypothetical protein WBG90_19585 [Saonia sp.]